MIETQIDKCIFSFEGLDGAGKSTQIPLVEKALVNLGLDVKVCKSPNSNKLGEFIRSNVRELEPWLRNQLFLLDIRYSLEKFLQQGFPTILLFDRYIDSFYTSNKEMSLREADLLTQDLPAPLKTYLLDVRPDYLLSKRKQSIHEHSDIEWLRLKDERYKKLVSRSPKRFVRIDARLPVEQITRLIVNSILMERKV